MLLLCKTKFCVIILKKALFFLQHAGNYQCEEYNESMMLTALSVVYEIVIYIRNIVLSSLYKYIVKPIFFKIDPETIHDYMISFGQIV